MISNDYITLRLVRVKPAQEWSAQPSGLAFLFPKFGALEYCEGSTRRQLQPGEVLVSNGAAKGQVKPTNGSEVAFWNFSVELENLFPLFTGQELGVLGHVVEEFKRAKVYGAGTAVAAECHRLLAEAPPSSDLGHRIQLLRVAGAVLGQEFASAQGLRVGGGRLEDHMTAVFEKLSAAEILHLSVDELAGKFHCSRRHLNRLFQQRFGVSVGALRMEMRLTKAASLLRHPGAKVIRVAEDCGFNHLGLFNTCFKKRFGASPGKWRTQAAEREGLETGAKTGGCPFLKQGVCRWSQETGRAALTPARAMFSLDIK